MYFTELLKCDCSPFLPHSRRQCASEKINDATAKLRRKFTRTRPKCPTPSYASDDSYNIVISGNPFTPIYTIPPSPVEEQHTIQTILPEDLSNALLQCSVRPRARGPTKVLFTLSRESFLWRALPRYHTSRDAEL